MTIQASVERTLHQKCQRCWRHHYSVGLVELYPKLCCICAYDIDNLLVANAEQFKVKES